MTIGECLGTTVESQPVMLELWTQIYRCWFVNHGMFTVSELVPLAPIRLRSIEAGWLATFPGFANVMYVAIPLST